MWKVYCHRNKINQKEYIGITSKENPNRRWRNGEGYIKCRKFYFSIQKYGWDGFEHIILFDNLSLDQAKLIEQKIIRKNKSKKLSYNITDGGDGNIGWVMSEKTKRKIAEKHTGRNLSEEHKQKISKGNKGKIVSEETKRKIAEKQTGHKMSEETKRKITEKYKAFFSTHESPLKGIEKTEEQKIKARLAQKTRITVYQYSNDGKLVKIFNSFREIRKIKGLDQIKIKELCNKNINKKFEECEQYKGFVFVYKEF